MASKEFYSNCLIEAVKAKLRNPKIKMMYCPAYFNEVPCPHWMWTDGSKEYDFSTGLLHWWQWIWHKGRIREYHSGTYSRYVSAMIEYKFYKKQKGQNRMGSKEFILKVKELVAEYANQHIDKSDNKNISVEDVFIVWSCKTLQNNKALASTTLFDGMYYEITYNGDKNEIYFDAYKKWENKCIKLGESNE